MVAGWNALTLSFIIVFNVTEVSFSVFILVVCLPQHVICVCQRKQILCAYAILSEITLEPIRQVSTPVGHIIRNPFLCGSHEIYIDNSGEI